MLARLVDYQQQYGHTIVDEDIDEELYRWTINIRRNYRHQVEPSTKNSSRSSSSRPSLPKDKIERLTAAGFCWDYQRVRWWTRYAELQAFYRLHRHCRVPPNAVDWPGLGIWVRNQRREHRRWAHGESSTLDEERRVALERLDFDWYRSQTETWEARFAELQEFIAERGHAHVPQQDSDYFQLGQWCMNQRIAYARWKNGESSALNDQRRQRLEAVGFSWSVRDQRWRMMLDRLVEFHEKNGHVAIKTSDEENADLRIWLIQQRYYYNRRQAGLSSPLTDERISTLEKAIEGFEWKARGGDSGPSSQDWSKLFAAMREKGIQPGMRPKQHWFEGTNPFSIDIKTTWTEEDLLALWNQEDDEDDDTDTDRWYQDRFQVKG